MRQTGKRGRKATSLPVRFVHAGKLCKGEKMVELQGYIDRIVFRNEENGYSVLCMKEGNKEEFLVGVFPDVSEGEYLTARGEMNVHPIYGKQLRVQEYEFTAPSDAASTLKYLSSGAIKGIGEALATRIVKKFGDDTFRIMEEEPERLAEVKGISMRKALEISGAVAGKRDLRQAMLFLQQYGITQNLGMKIYNFYQGRLYQVIRENPYKLADDIDGVGFRIADEIASKAGILPDSDFRIRSGILYVLEQATGQGHTCLPMDQLMQEARRLLGVEIDSMNDRIMDLIMDKKIVVKTKEDIQMVYSSVSYYTELTIAQMLKDLNIKDTITSDEIAAKIKAIETEQDIALDERQRLAVSEAVNNGLTIITGGPGTGKTTTIRTIIRYFEKEGLDILLAAPTGRAAKRMKEATGCEAKTVHRLLELSGMVGEGATSFGRNEDNPLETDVVIIDEVSMVDIFLMKSLLRALVPGMRLILVGDVNQLPSVGPGNVLRDMIYSDAFPVVRLEKIFRQAAESDIIMNAHRINAGEMVEPRPGSRDFLFIKRDNPGNIIGATITLLKDKLPNYVNSSTRDIQVLTPMRKGLLGVEQLNAALQEALNPPDPSKQELTVGSFILREGDKVMQIKNNYQMEWKVLNSYRMPLDEGVGVFNGDMGIVREINSYAERITVEFEEGRRVEYEFKQAEELELAYAVTIHKSQGSEYPAVILPLLGGPRMLMNRNLLYTGVTRAKSCVCIVGSVHTFQEMIANEQEQKRYSGLKDRIKEVYELA